MSDHQGAEEPKSYTVLENVHSALRHKVLISHLVLKLIGFCSGSVQRSLNNPLTLPLVGAVGNSPLLVIMAATPEGGCCHRR